MSFSRPAFWSALCSCMAHSAVLGLAAALVVSEPQRTSRAVKISLVERAVPLPIGDAGDAGNGAPTPVEEKAPLRPEPQPQPKPKKAPRPKPIAKKPSPPAVPVAPAPAEVPQQQDARLTSPPETSRATDPAEFLQGNENAVTGNRSEGSSGNNGKTGGRNSNGTGRGGGDGVSAHPDYSVNPKPPYPLIARRLGVQGVVVLRVQVRDDGSVATVELARSSGFAMLDESASRTVRENWRFLPARVDGIPVASWVEVPIRFVLEDS